MTESLRRWSEPMSEGLQLSVCILSTPSCPPSSSPVPPRAVVARFARRISLCETQPEQSRVGVLSRSVMF